MLPIIFDELGVGVVDEVAAVDEVVAEEFDSVVDDASVGSPSEIVLLSGVVGEGVKEIVRQVVSGVVSHP